ncbi:MAG TPA: anthrone oxygenase family protein [Tepidisphaeraceae bacterium]|jgi:uncharacterized membrane protein
MMPIIVSTLTWLAVVGCGLVAGVFFAFSSFVMAALTRLAPAQGVAAMQSINVAVINVSFMGLLFGTAGLCVVLAAASVIGFGRPGAGWAIAGCLCYLVGTIGVTIVFHVPRNDALALLDPLTPQTADAWSTYVRAWTLGNHVRTAAAIVAMGLLILSACLPRHG